MQYGPNKHNKSKTRDLLVDQNRTRYIKEGVLFDGDSGSLVLDHEAVVRRVEVTADDLDGGVVGGVGACRHADGAGLCGTVGDGDVALLKRHERA